MFDSTLSGEEIEHGTHLQVDVAPDTYLIRTAYLEPEDGLALVLVELAQQTLPA